MDSLNICPPLWRGWPAINFELDFGVLWLSFSEFVSAVSSFENGIHPKLHPTSFKYLRYSPRYYTSTRNNQHLPRRLSKTSWSLRIAFAQGGAGLARPNNIGCPITARDEGGHGSPRRSVRGARTAPAARPKRVLRRGVEVMRISSPDAFKMGNHRRGRTEFLGIARLGCATARKGVRDWRARRDSNSRPSGSKPDALSS